MVSFRTTKEIISVLKGRISKALNIPRKLTSEELIALGRIYDVIDSIILWDKEFTKNKATRFKKVIKEYSSFIKNSKKEYIKKHINPVIDTIVEQEWV